jgi:hypothetical protein
VSYPIFITICAASDSGGMELIMEKRKVECLKSGDTFIVDNIGTGKPSNLYKVLKVDYKADDQGCLSIICYGFTPSGDNPVLVLNKSQEVLMG